MASEISEVEADRDSGKPVNFENGCCHTNSPHRGFEVSRRNVIRRGHNLDEAGLGLRQSGGEDVFELFRFRKPQAGTPKCSASLQKSGLPCTPLRSRSMATKDSNPFNALYAHGGLVHLPFISSAQ